MLGVAGWEEQVERQLLEPFGGWGGFKDRAAGLGLWVQSGTVFESRTNCDAASEPEGRGWRSCWGRDLSRLTVGAPSPNLWFSSDLSYFLPSQVCTCSRAWNIFLLPLPGSLLALQVPAQQLVLLECC